MLPDYRSLNTVPDKFKIPQFTSEAEEAQWWFDHRQELAQAFQDAADKGQLHSGSVARIARERAASVLPS
jgi:proline dehydrogenase